MKDVCRTLHPFGYVTVPEKVRLDGVLFRETEFEGADAAGLGKTVVYSVDGYLTVELLFVEEEAALEVDKVVGPSMITSGS